MTREIHLPHPARSRRAGPGFPDRPPSSPAKADLRPVLEPGVTIQTVLNSHLDHSRDTDSAPPPVQSVDLDVWDVKVVLRDADDSVYPDLVDLKT